MRLRILFICVLALLTVSGWIASLVATAQNDIFDSPSSRLNNTAINDKGSASAQAFVMTLNAQGKATCRLASPSERSRIMQRQGDSQVIYAGAPRRSATGEKDLAPGALSGEPFQNLQASAGLRIVLHGTAQFNQSQNQAARNAFIVAANRWEALISTPITVVLDVDFGTSIFGTPFPSEDILGATGTEEDTRFYPEVRERLIANSPTTAEGQLYNALPALDLPTQLSNKAFKSLTVRLSRANSRALGFVPDIMDPNAIPLGGGDAAIGFNSAFPFDFNPNNGIDSNKVDFDSVATHEIGHALGFLSESGGPVYAPTSMWDVFRFRPNAASIGTFAIASRIMSSGGTQVYFNGQNNSFGTQELRLSTGGPSGTAGDGNQSSHWKDDDLTFQYIGIMDPTLGEGERNPITTNDVTTIDSLGYSIGSPVPAPPPPPADPPPLPPNDNLANATVIQDVNGATIGNSTGATKEAGEPVMLPGNAGGVGGRSVWYRWTSPVNGTATFDTEGSGFDTTLAVSTGNSIGDLARLNQNDDLEPGETTSSRVTFSVTAGVTYQLAVDGFDNGNGAESGLIEINWSATGVAPSPCTTTFSNSGSIAINDSTAPPTTAAPYPASINVTGIAGTVAKLTVSLNGLDHTFPDDLDVLLVGPQGQSLIVLSDAGGGANADVSLTLDDSAATSLPDTGPLVSGTFRPTNVGGGDNFPPPAPAPPYNSTAPAGTATLSSVFNGINPNGTWSLYVIDDENLDDGSITGGWSLAITTAPCAPPAVQFDALTYTPSESIGSKTVMVTRTGDTSGAATVNYATSDTGGANDCSVPNTGNASSRCDYESTAGTLRFAAGETSKSISIPIVDDVYAEGNESLTIALSHASGASLGSPGIATVTINDNETTTGTNPINDAEFFVRLHYIDFFTREPDAGGLAFWRDQITSCGTDQACTQLRRVNISGAFFLSIEFQETGYLVYRFYKAAYGNLPGLPVPVRFNEFLPDTQQIGQGVVVGQIGWEQALANNKQAFAAEFVTRSRFTTAYPTTQSPAQFVDALYLNAGVTPSSTDRTAAINEFGGAINTADLAGRGRVLRQVAEDSILRQQETNRAFVLMQYFGYLRRNPNDPPEAGLNFDGYNFWLGKLNQFNGNFVNAEMVKAFIVSGEYRSRFGP